MNNTKTIPALCILVFLTQTLFAATFTFSGAANGLWEDPSNWSPGYPGLLILEGDQIIIQNECTINGYQIVNHGGIIVTDEAKLVLSNAGYLENYNIVQIDGSVQLISGSTLINRGIFTIQAGGSVTNSSYFVNDNGLLHNYGAIQNLTGGFQNSAFGQFIHAPEATFINNAQLNNSGFVTIDGTGFENFATIQNDGDWTVNNTMQNHGDLHNNGMLSIQQVIHITAGGSLLNHAVMDIAPGGAFVNDGIFNNFIFGEVLNAGTLTCLSTGLVTNQGTFTTYSGSSFENYGFITNEGPIHHAGSFDNHGALQSFHMIRNEGAIDNHGIFTVETTGDLQLTNGSHFVSYHEGVLTIK